MFWFFSALTLALATLLPLALFLCFSEFSLRKCWLCPYQKINENEVNSLSKCSTTRKKKTSHNNIAFVEKLRPIAERKWFLQRFTCSDINFAVLKLLLLWKWSTCWCFSWLRAELIMLMRHQGTWRSLFIRSTLKICAALSFCTTCLPCLSLSCLIN